MMLRFKGRISSKQLNSLGQYKITRDGQEILLKKFTYHDSFESLDEILNKLDLRQFTYFKIETI